MFHHLARRVAPALFAVPPVIPVKITPERMTRNSSQWQRFLEMNYRYMIENWPEKFGDKSEEEFTEAYEKTLIERMSQGPRGLFLYSHQGQPTGFSNGYITSNSDGKRILNIAEFFVEPQFRRQHLGRQMVEHLIEWGKEEEATELQIEVDKDLPSANKFWSTFDYQLDSSGIRNIYSHSFQ